MMAKLTEMREKLISKKKDNKGFTLVELIVVIVILAILVGVTIGGVYSYVNKSRINTDINNASAITSTLSVCSVNKNIGNATVTAVGSPTPVELSNNTTPLAAGDIAAKLGLDTADTDHYIATLLPDGIPVTKTSGAKFVATTTVDAKGHLVTIVVSAVDSTGAPLVAQE